MSAQSPARSGQPPASPPWSPASPPGHGREGRSGLAGQRAWLRRHGLKDWEPERPSGSREPSSLEMDFLFSECARTGQQSGDVARAAFAWLPQAERADDAPPAVPLEELTSTALEARLKAVDAALRPAAALPAERAHGILERRSSAGTILLMDWRPPAKWPGMDEALAPGQKPPKPATEKDRQAAQEEQQTRLELERKSLTYKLAVAVAADGINTQLSRWQKACDSARE